MRFNKLYGNPLAILGVTMTLSVLVFILKSTALLFYSLFFTIFAVITSERSYARRALPLIALFIAFFMASGMVLQFLLGKRNPLFIGKSSLRMWDLGVLGLFAYSNINISRLALDLSRVSPKLSFLTLVSLRSFDLFIGSLERLIFVYNVNYFSNGSLRDRIRYILRISRGFSYNMVLQSLLLSEALYTRQHLFHVTGGSGDNS